MKKAFLGAVSVVLTGCLMAGCAAGASSTSGSVNTVSDSVQKKQLNIVTTVFPIYDWTKNILGDDLENVTLTYLEDGGADVHSYEPSVQDMVTMTNCDMFIYIGGDSDTWVDGVLANAENDDMVVLNLVNELGDQVRGEAEVEGMQAHDHEEEADHDHDHEEDADHDHDHEEAADHDHDHEEDADHDHDHGEEADHDHELDEHIWLSLKNAAIVCQLIEQALATLNPAQADLYAANLEEYLSQLTALDAEYQAVVEKATQTTLLFADRFPFLYLMEDYDLDYYAAFAGCSSETEASFETIAFLAGKVDECGLKVVLTTEDAAPGVAQTVIASTTDKNHTILALDSMQAVTASEVAEGVSYLTIMQSNLDVITQAVQ